MGIQLDMRMAMCPQLMQILRCETCRQSIDQEEVRHAKILTKLFGKINYAICPTCYQQVVGHKDRAYRQRAGKVIRLLKCQHLLEKNKDV